MLRITGPRVVTMLAVITLLSQFHRAALSAIGPDLMRELGLTPEGLGFANGLFFVPLVLGMIPVGLSFDRWGPRRTVLVLTAIAVAGSLGHAVITDGAGLVAARLAIGIGCAGSFMSAVLLTARWYAGERFTTVLSWVFAASNVGTVLAGSPFAALAEALGWRGAFVAAAAATALAGLLFGLYVRDAPPGHAMAVPVRESAGEVLRGLVAVWRTPGLGRVLFMHFFAYSSMLTVLGLLAGPYLADVHGLGAVARGHVVTAMAAGQIVGLLCYGPLDRLVDSRKRVVLGGGTLTVAVLGTLALWPAPPLAAAGALLVLHCLVTAYPIVIVAHGRSLFPERLAGRGVTTVNMGQTAGSALLPMLAGTILGLFPPTEAGGAPEAAYRAAFAAVACLVATGLAVYAGARDSRPSGRT